MTTAPLPDAEPLKKITRQQRRDAERKAKKEKSFSQRDEIRLAHGAIVADCFRKKTDVAAAAIYAQFARGKLLYNYQNKSWVFYDGTRWLHEYPGKAMDHAKYVVQRLTDIANNLEDEDERRAGIIYVLALESRKKLEAMIDLARNELAATNADFDCNAFTLNCKNGTLDLKTGTLRKHNPANKITKITPVVYDPAATCPRWEQFLREIMLSPSGETDEQLVAYLQILVGYCLTGEVREHLLCICHGSGRNGKSTMLDVLLALLGDYGQASDTTLFTAQTQRGPCEEKARLKGVRLATASELPDGSVLAENTMKALSGGDKIVANFKYGHTFEFEPSHTFLVATNHAPIVHGDDPAIWGRLKLIPFRAYYPDGCSTIDKRLKEKLMAELSGILNWAITGYKSYQEKGLHTPEAVRVATDGYRTDSDLLAAFINDECVRGENCHAKASLLYARYKLWHDLSGENRSSLLTIRKFTTKLREHGFGSHTADGVVFDGISLRDLDPAERTRNNGTNEGHFQNFSPATAREKSLGKGGSFIPSFRYPRETPDDCSTPDIGISGNASDAAAKEDWLAAL